MNCSVAAKCLAGLFFTSYSYKLLTYHADLSQISAIELKPRPNDRNMPTQHIAKLLGAACCVRLAILLQHVATCWVLLAQIWLFSNLSQQHPTCCNTSQPAVAKRIQHVAPNNAAICCGDLLRSFGRGLTGWSCFRSWCLGNFYTIKFQVVYEAGFCSWTKKASVIISEMRSKIKTNCWSLKCCVKFF